MPVSTNPDDCAPLSLTRAVVDFPIGNIPLRDHQSACLSSCPGCACHPQAWLDPTDVAAFLASGSSVMTDFRNTPVLWLGEVPDLQAARFSASGSFAVRYPWDLLRANEKLVAGLRKHRIEGEVHPSAVIEGIIQLGPGSRILPGVFIEGNVIIGANCKIGPNCYLRGSTSIGDSCHIGQSVEIKNCLMLSRTNVGHLSYVGDSILGQNVNFGAGTTTSNLRHDGKSHRSMVRGELIDTGRRKFGTVVGDGVHTGINTTIYPGRKFWPGTSTEPGQIVRYDVMP